MRVLLLNQFVPPDPAPTARLLADVARELETRGHEIAWIGNGSPYHGAKTLLGSRALRELAELGKLLVKGWTAPRCDRILFLSSPPFLPVVANLVAWRHRGARLVHWAMDVYPDVAVSLGETRADSPVARITSRLMARAYRSCDTVISLDEDMASRLESHHVRPVIQAPWPPELGDAAPNRFVPSERFRILYSGNLGRAHDWKTILDALAILQEERIEMEMIFQGGGIEREKAKAYSEDLGLRNCSWEPYVDSHDLLPSLLAADALLATQREETRGCLWPSKLALSVLTGVPILWIGPRDGAVSRWLAEKGHHPFGIGDAAGVASALRELHAHRDTNRSRARRAADVAAESGKLALEGSRYICDIISIIN